MPNHASKIIVAAALLVSGCSSSDPQLNSLDVTTATLEVAQCQPNQVQTGFAFLTTGGFLITAAHTLVDGTEAKFVIDGAELAADLIAVDFAKDIAVFETPGEAGASLEEPQEGSAQLVRPGSVNEIMISEPEVVSFKQGPDVSAFEVKTGIEPGDSGLPIVQSNKIVGMVIAASSTDSNLGWAISSTEIGAALENKAGISNDPVFPASCE